eukprot:TRINITY_DN20293_c0_g1_i1.p1 TRINITY_DN20293_c0_g1~~TRINITY_DN20293_c0_g1_i1.p1  ORF type:complete len:157 (-),score=24.04 TRINITY_DN20293_c0_g1_i1:53-523(-)
MGGTVAVAILLTVFSLCVLISLTLLLGFHGLLTIKGITTHEYLGRLYEEERNLLVMAAEAEALDSPSSSESADMCGSPTPRGSSTYMLASPLRRLSQFEAAMQMLSGAEADDAMAGRRALSASMSPMRASNAEHPAHHTRSWPLLKSMGDPTVVVS